MSTNAATWFYAKPENNPYLIVERLNGTFWQARVGQILFTACTQTEPTLRCRGYYRDEPIELEWEPRQWLSLTGSGDLDALTPYFTRILGFAPSFRYHDADDRAVYEWHRDEAKRRARWQSIQGKSSFKAPESLTAT